MQNYVQPGKRLATYNASSTVTAPGGVPVVVGNRIRIPVADIPPLSWGEAAAEEVFLLPAKSADTWVDGATLYWDATNGWLTVESTSYMAGGSVPTIIGGVPVGGKAPGVTLASVKLPCDPVAATTTGLTQQANIPQLSAQTQDALTVTAMTGAANTAPAAETNLDTLTDSTGGTPATTLAAVGAGGTGTAAGGWDTANHRDAAILAINTNFSSLIAELALQKALNTVLVNNNKTFAVELNKAKADVAALIAKVNAMLTSDQAAGVRASS